MSDPSNPPLTLDQAENNGIPIDPSLLSPQPATLASAISPSQIPAPLPLSTLDESSPSYNDQQQSTPTLEVAMSSTQAELPTFTPYVPNSGVNGRRTSTSGSKGVNGQHRSVGPELSTPHKLAQVSGGTFIPTGEPPYEPPLDIIYPPDRILNPYWNDMSLQPVIENFPANSLYRPKYLPSDIDDRLDKKSVWIGIEKDSSRAVYFLPPTCQCCKNPAVAQHCDRGWPNCARCLGRGVTCIPGKAWGMMRPKGKRRNLKAEAAKSKITTIQALNAFESNLPGPSSIPISIPAPTTIPHTSSAKGKGKAAQQYDTLAPLPNLLAETQRIESMDIEDQNSQSTKKRRISSVGIEEDSNKRIRRKSRSNKDTIGPLPLSSDLPLNRADREYFSRLEDNSRKLALNNMNGPCPVWAKTRKSLITTVEYLRDPKKTNGASVDIGVGGVARGVILEGEVVGAQGVFWGRGEDTGTMITAIGHPRRQRSDRTVELDESRPSSPHPEQLTGTLQRSSTPPLNILPSVVNARHPSQPHSGDRSMSETKSFESSEVAALLMAQRARTPVAVGVAQDYSPVPFKVPRPFIVLGWFWITDAWLEPVMPDLELFVPYQHAPSGPPELVVWKFRFDWCTGSSQNDPWWSSTLEPSRPIPLAPAADSDKEWQITGSGSGSSTVLPPTSGTMNTSSLYQHICENCKYSSERVYDTGDICLNEGCSWFFGDASSVSNRIGPLSNRPSTLRNKTRISPESLGLRLSPPEPIGTSYDMSQSHAGREFWRGWVCRKCGLAQERYKWVGWCCEACGYSVTPPRRIYTADDLRPPSRPVYTSERQDGGYASFPYKVERVWSSSPSGVTWEHLLDPSIFGYSSKVHHTLGYEGKHSHGARAARKVAGEALRALQAQGDNEIPLRRCIESSTTRRPVELTLSPFYTYRCGSDTSPISGFTTYRSVNWQNAPPIFLDIIDTINERAGRMLPAQPQFVGDWQIRKRLITLEACGFQSLLIAANPPNSSTGASPKISIEPNSYMAILFLGSETVVRIKPGNGRGKPGEITAQHGDIIAFKSGSEGMDISLKMDNFGFFCIARYVKSNEGLPPPQTASSESRLSIESFPPHLRSDSQPSSSVEPLSATFPNFLDPLPSFDIPPGPQVIIDPIPEKESTPLSGIKKSRSKVNVPPKKVKLAKMSLKNWYIGGYPLHPEQPIRILPPYRPIPTDEPLNEYVIILEEESEEFIQFDPIPLSPLPGYDDLEPELPIPTPNKRSTPATKKGKSSTTITPIATPTSGKRKRGVQAKPSKTSISNTPSVIDAEDDTGTPSAKSTGTITPSRRGGKRGRGRGRKSVA